jgi:hypothetical protein
LISKTLTRTSSRDNNIDLQSLSKEVQVLEKPTLQTQAIMVTALHYNQVYISDFSYLGAEYLFSKTLTRTLSRDCKVKPTEVQTPYKSLSRPSDASLHIVGKGICMVRPCLNASEAWPYEPTISGFWVRTRSASLGFRMVFSQILRAGVQSFL